MWDCNLRCQPAARLSRIRADSPTRRKEVPSAYSCPPAIASRSLEKPQQPCSSLASSPFSLPSCLSSRPLSYLLSYSKHASPLDPDILLLLLVGCCISSSSPPKTVCSELLQTKETSKERGVFLPCILHLFPLHDPASLVHILLIQRRLQSKRKKKFRIPKTIRERILSIKLHILFLYRRHSQSNKKTKKTKKSGLRGKQRKWKLSEEKPKQQ